MKKLFGLALLALAFLAPDLAQAANRFLTCNTACTITAADTSIWGTVSGGTGATVPTTTDDVILDANTCVGGTTCTATFGAGYNPTWISFTMSLCTASTSGCIVDANTNGNTITLTGATGFVNTGSGTRTLSGGTWVLSAASVNWNSVASATISNSPSVNFSSSSGSGRNFTGGGKTYGTLTIGAAGSNGSGFTFQSGNNTFGTLTINAPNRISTNASTHTVTTMTDVTGSASQQVLFTTFNGISTFSSANNWTCQWCGIHGYTFSGGGTFSAPDSFNFGGNTNITITAPSGGAATPRTIGG